mmetsp:Transcript_27153/g.60082  ORF Transcript_27153/g.60082 Transcript_27153/m.60082 type:complete len:279 (-) Transcript_27153:14-850(-)
MAAEGNTRRQLVRLPAYSPRHPSALTMARKSPKSPSLLPRPVWCTSFSFSSGAVNVLAATPPHETEIIVCHQCRSFVGVATDISEPTSITTEVPAQCRAMVRSEAIGVFSKKMRNSSKDMAPPSSSISTLRIKSSTCSSDIRKPILRIAFAISPLFKKPLWSVSISWKTSSRCCVENRFSNSWKFSDGCWGDECSLRICLISLSVFFTPISRNMCVSCSTSRSPLLSLSQRSNSRTRLWCRRASYPALSFRYRSSRIFDTSSFIALPEVAEVQQVGVG